MTEICSGSCSRRNRGKFQRGDSPERAQVDYNGLYAQMVKLRNWHWWFRVHYAWIRDLLSPYLVPRARVLDIGCGPGRSRPT